MESDANSKKYVSLVGTLLRPACFIKSKHLLAAIFPNHAFSYVRSNSDSFLYADKNTSCVKSSASKLFPIVL